MLLWRKPCRKRTVAIATICAHAIGGIAELILACHDGKESSSSDSTSSGEGCFSRLKKSKTAPLSPKRSKKRKDSGSTIEKPFSSCESLHSERSGDKKRDNKRFRLAKASSVSSLDNVDTTNKLQFELHEDEHSEIRIKRKRLKRQTSVFSISAPSDTNVGQSRDNRPELDQPETLSNKPLKRLERTHKLMRHTSGESNQSAKSTELGFTKGDYSYSFSERKPRSPPPSYEDVVLPRRQSEFVPNPYHLPPLTDPDSRQPGAPADVYTGSSYPDT